MQWNTCKRLPGGGSVRTPPSSIQEVTSYLSGQDEGVFREVRGTGVTSVVEGAERLQATWCLVVAGWCPLHHTNARC